MWAFQKSYMLFLLVLKFYGKLKHESLNSAPKLPYLGVFRLKFEKKKTTLTFEATSNFSKRKLLCKIKKA